MFPLDERHLAICGGSIFRESSYWFAADCQKQTIRFVIRAVHSLVVARFRALLLVFMPEAGINR